MTFAEDYWRKASFPTPEHFQKELIDLYLRAAPHYDNRPLDTEYLAQIIKVIVEFYRQEFPPELPVQNRNIHTDKLKDPHRTYQLILGTFLKSLVSCTQRYPYRNPMGEQQNPLFWEYVSSYNADDEPNFELSTALAGLREPFIAELTALRQCGFQWETWAPYAWASFTESKPRFHESEPIYGDQYERRRWRQREREFKETDLEWWKENKARYEKDHKWAHANTIPLQQLLVYSPFFFSAHILVPAVRRPFEIPPNYWFRATWIVGAPDTGKSNLLRHLILQHAPDASVILMDAKGDVFKSLTRMASIKDRLVIIEPDLDYPPALNPLALGRNSVEFLSYLFELLDAKMTANQTQLFRRVLALVEKIPGATLEDFRKIIRDGWEPYEEYVRTLDEDHQRFFAKDFHTRLYSERKPEVLLRLDLLLSNPYLKAMLASEKLRVNFGELMDGGKIICINNSYDPDKLGEEGCEFFGRMIIALVWAAARRRANRPDNKKRPVFFFMDEAHFVIRRDKTIKKIINQCRSQKIAMVFSHQEVKDIEDSEVLSALNGCGIKFANSRGDAHELAPRLFTTPEFIKSQSQGSFATFVTDKTDAAVSIRVPLVPVRHDHTLIDHPTIGDHEYHALMLTMHARYCAGYEEPRPAAADPTHYDLYWEITVNPAVAKAGGTKREQGYDITIPPGTKHGRKLRLRGKGVLRPDGTRGDIIVTVTLPPQARPGEPQPLPDRSGREDW